MLPSSKPPMACRGSIASKRPRIDCSAPDCRSVQRWKPTEAHLPLDSSFPLQIVHHALTLPLGPRMRTQTDKACLSFRCLSAKFSSWCALYQEYSSPLQIFLPWKRDRSRPHFSLIRRPEKKKSSWLCLPFFLVAGFLSGLSKILHGKFSR